MCASSVRTYPGGMVDDGWALLAGVGGLLLGAALTWFLVASMSRTQRGREPAEVGPEVEDGVAAVLDVLRSAAVVVASDGRVVRENAAARAFGLVRDGRVAHAELQSLVTAARSDRTVQDADVELPRGALPGGALLLRVRAAPTGQDTLLLAEDRTEAVRVEAIRRDFVVNVSHELKTPTGALHLLAETVENAADDPDAVRRFAGRMQTEAVRLSALVQEIIQLSRLQDAEPLEAVSRVDVAAVVSEALDRARVTANARGIALDVGRLPEVTVAGDHDLLVTAVRNLLDNAIAYSDRGTRVAVGIAVRPASGLVEIAVVDQGIGIPADALPRLFERFYRVDQARSRDTGGTGLGLSIVKHVAADHGGDVTVWSQPGQGSTFTVRLPVEASSGAERPFGADRTTPVRSAASVSDVPSVPAGPTGTAVPADPPVPRPGPPPDDESGVAGRTPRHGRFTASRSAQRAQQAQQAQQAQRARRGPGTGADAPTEGAAR